MSDLWATMYQALGLAGAEKQAPAGAELAKGGSSWAAKLSSAGLGAYKPSLQTLQKVQPILAAMMPAEDACLVQAWLGGAHDRADLSFLFTDIGLTAQSACGVSAWSQALGDFAYRSVAEALDDLASQSADKAAAAELIRKAGKATAKQSAKKQDEEAQKDAKEMAKGALDALTPQGFGGAVSLGAGVAVAVVIAVVAWKVLK